MKISIIVPIYNVEKEIIRCLSSVVEQSYPKIELIIVNDGSPDNSYQIALDFLREHKFLSQTLCLEHDVNKGLSEARNTGLSVATGDYIFFLDSDDNLNSKNSISCLVELAVEHNFPDIVIGNSQTLVDGKVKEINPLEEQYLSTNDEVYKKYSMGKGIYWSACARLIKLRLIKDKELSFKKGIYSEDILWSFYLFRIANNAYTTSTIVYDYHGREGSIMSSMNSKHLDDLGIIIKDIYKFFLENKNVYMKETVNLIERYRRMYLQYLFYLKDKDKYYREQKLIELKQLRLPLIIFGNFKYFRQNLLLRMPVFYIERYLFLKWKHKEYRH